MKIEIGINPNCSEATMRLSTNKLTKEQEEKLYNELTEFVEKYNYETYIDRSNVFGIDCIVINGDAPYNSGTEIENIVKRFPFADKIKIETEEG